MSDLHPFIQRTAHWLIGGAGALLLLGLLMASTRVAAAPPGVVTLPSSADLRAGTFTYTTYLPSVARDHYTGPSMFGVELPSRDLTLPTVALSLSTDAHVYWARWRLPWSYVEPISTTPSTYHWPDLDPSIAAAAQQGLHLIWTIDSNPPWAGQFKSGPINPTAIPRFTDFVRSAVERYDGDGNADAPGSPVVDYWEFYNEPDGGSLLEAWNGTGSYWGKNPGAYAAMLCGIYPAVKAASPHAQVLFGGVAHDLFDDEGNPPGPFVRSFIDDVLTAIQAISPGQPCFDYMNFHYYPAFRSAWDPYGPGLVGKMNYMRAKLQNHGMGNVPVLVTELGWHSNFIPGSTYSSSPQIQANYVLKLYAEALAANPKLAIWFSWLDPGSTGFDNGLLYPPDPQHSAPWPKPAYTAYSVAAYRLQAARYLRTLSTAELGSTHLEGYLATPAPAGGAQQQYLLWSNDDYTSMTTYPVSLPASQARAVDVYGTPGPVIRDADDGLADGRVTLRIGVHAVYVEVWP